MGQIKTNNEQFETGILADHRGQLLAVGPDSGAVDAFGRARMSEPLTLFDSTLRYTKRTDQWNETTSGSAVVNYIEAQSSANLVVTTANGDSVLRRTKRRFPYQPGKSLMILQSFAGTSPIAGIKQEVGFFDNDNGVMLRVNGTTIQFVIRSSASGSLVEEVVDQSQWNIDRFTDLDISKANIFVADLEWLGVGRVRCGFVVNGEYKYCHEFNHANLIGGVYMTTAILPLSYRIESTGAASGATLKQICSSVMSEGGYEPTGPIYHVGRGATGVASISTEQVVAGIRMASGRTGNVIMPVQVDASIEGNTIGQWRLRLNPTLSGASWTASANGRGNVETITGVTSFSGGTVIGVGLIGNRGASAFEAAHSMALTLGVNANGASDELVLTLEADTTTKGTGIIGWHELV
jgi:hypothetical protein